jgi:Acetyltransferase (GNAT) domain
MIRKVLKDRPHLAYKACCYQLNPLQDARWAKFVDDHPKSSIFHSVGWLRALQLTYGYEPVVFTTSPPTDELRDGIVFCDIQSWLTGRRLVSLPFSDHCEPLLDSVAKLKLLIHDLKKKLELKKCRYLEFRPVDETLTRSIHEEGFVAAGSYFLHVVDLVSSLDEIFKGLHKDSVRRRIQRAARAGLIEKFGRSEELLKQFYSLFVATRGRHHLPPIPYPWFRNLVECVGEALELRLAYLNDVPISAILTLRFKDVVYYKYGCSDIALNNFGATPWLLWRAIEAAKSAGASSFDLGRTEKENLGLLTFKNHWDLRPRSLSYWKYPDAYSLDSVDSRRLKVAKRIFSIMPNSLLRFTGRMIYRHIG